MKKILLGTSALIGAGLLAGSALAEDPKVTVGGFSNFEAGYVKDDYDANEQRYAFRNDTEIHFNIAGKTDAGLGYGAEIDLEADVNGDGATTGSTNQGIVAHRTYGWLQGDNWGHFEMGSNDGAARTLKVDASNIARASGGIDGDWYLFANTNVVGSGNLSGFAGGRTFITAPRLPVEHGPSTTYATDVWGNDNKVTYYTPRFAGFQVGVSYAPNLVDRGELTTRADSNLGFINARDIFSGGVNYENQFDQIGLAAALTGEEAHADSLAIGSVNNLRAWNAGAKASWLGWSLAGSYGDWVHSFNVGSQAQYWTGGLAYETGPIGASVTYLGSQNKPTGEDNKFQDVSVGVDYKLAPGLTPFVEYTWFDVNPEGGSVVSGGGAENRGSVVLIGSQLSF